jgi:hypothetical protein
MRHEGYKVNRGILPAAGLGLALLLTGCGQQCSAAGPAAIDRASAVYAVPGISAPRPPAPRPAPAYRAPAPRPAPAYRAPAAPAPIIINHSSADLSPLLWWSMLSNNGAGSAECRKDG